ncbi:myeloid-associated differentiation marker homolog [Hemiscyllium ocellatum]|uniref:myeloid-associated differentiation marker homolog n=1 Tax=Hemiscyllium ocellatum TaxID=170820 RepID=UPI002966898E|nr:myeloid-associated differentiation marker homolog [Hemiscyllium ocellatum]XP_060679168.1 myeloid-associated differentiation marker homolog [Hemiscyllium ocellatum]
MAAPYWRALSGPLGLSRLLGAALACAALSLVVHSGRWWGAEGSWCLFAWAFSFVGAALVLLTELAGGQSRSPVPWSEGPPALAPLACLLCLSATAVYPLWFLRGGGNGGRALPVAGCVCSGLATAAFAAETFISRARPGETAGYLASLPGRLKVLECFAACLIFVLASDVDYGRHAGLQWCMAVYGICFVLSLAAVLACLASCTGRLPVPFPRFATVCALLGALLYATAAVVWPVFCFDRRYGQPRRPAGCGNMGVGRCPWDSAVGVAVLTCALLLAYLADLVYSGRLVFVRR